MIEKKSPSFLPAFAWFVICTALLILPGSAFPKENWLEKIYADKLIHIFLFAVLAALWCRVMLKRFTNASKLKTIFLRTGILCLAYGVAMEFVQKYWIPNRSFDAGDIVADGAGVFFGVIFSIRRYIKK
jgi:VanZ family protein